MKPVALEVTSDLLRRNAGGAVYGNIALRVGASAFPHIAWTDFVVVVLTWWCAAMQRLMRGENGSVDIRFMDGPFLASVDGSGAAAWTITLIEDGKVRRTKVQADIDPTSLVSSVLEAADKTIASCRRQGWLSRDLEQLMAAAAAARNEMRRWKPPGPAPNVN